MANKSKFCWTRVLLALLILGASSLTAAHDAVHVIDVKDSLCAACSVVQHFDDAITTERPLHPELPYILHECANVIELDASRANSPYESRAPPQIT